MNISARKRSLQEVIYRVLDEMIPVDHFDGTTDKATVEEAIIRAAAKRALDPRSRLGMESTRFLAEYGYGKPVQPIEVNRGFDDPYTELSEEELLEMQNKLVGRAAYATIEGSSGDPGGMVSEGVRAEVVQGLLEAGRDDSRRFNEVQERRKEEKVRREADEEERAKEIWEIDTDELLKGPWS